MKRHGQLERDGYTASPAGCSPDQAGDTDFMSGCQRPSCEKSLVCNIDARRYTRMENKRNPKTYSLRCDRPATEGMLRALWAAKKQPVAERRCALTDRPVLSPGRSKNRIISSHPCSSVFIQRSGVKDKGSFCNIDARRYTRMKDQGPMRNCGCHRDTAPMPSTPSALRAADTRREAMRLDRPARSITRAVNETCILQSSVFIRVHPAKRCERQRALLVTSMHADTRR